MSVPLRSTWQPPTLTLSSYPYVSQGESNVGVVKLKMWTDLFSGALSKIRVTHSGSGLDTDINQVRLYLDTQPNKVPPGDGVFNFSVDKLVGTATLLDSLRLVKPHGIVSMTGIVGDRWTANG